MESCDGSVYVHSYGTEKVYLRGRGSRPPHSLLLRKREWKTALLFIFSMCGRYGLWAVNTGEEKFYYCSFTALC